MPTSLTPTRGSTVVEQMLAVDGCQYKMTCVSMGNPHAVTYSVDGRPIKVGGEEGGGTTVARWMLHAHTHKLTVILMSGLAFPIITSKSNACHMSPSHVHHLCPSCIHTLCLESSFPHTHFSSAG